MILNNYTELDAVVSTKTEDVNYNNKSFSFTSEIMNLKVSFTARKLAAVMLYSTETRFTCDRLFFMGSMKVAAKIGASVKAVRIARRDLVNAGFCDVVKKGNDVKYRIKDKFFNSKGNTLVIPVAVVNLTKDFPTLFNKKTAESGVKAIATLFNYGNKGVKVSCSRNSTWHKKGFKVNDSSFRRTINKLMDKGLVEHTLIQFSEDEEPELAYKLNDNLYDHLYSVVNKGERKNYININNVIHYHSRYKNDTKSNEEGTENVCANTHSDELVKNYCANSPCTGVKTDANRGFDFRQIAPHIIDNTTIDFIKERNLRNDGLDSLETEKHINTEYLSYYTNESENNNTQSLSSDTIQIENTKLSVLKKDNEMLRKPKQVKSKSKRVDFGESLSEVVDIAESRKSAVPPKNPVRTSKLYQRSGKIKDVQKAYTDSLKGKARVAKNNDLGSIEARWREGIIDSTDGSFLYVGWTHVEKGIVNTFIKKMNLPKEEVGDFFYHAGKNWSSIINNYYDWMKGDIKYSPTIKVMVKFKEGFVASYNERGELSEVVKYERQAKKLGRKRKPINELLTITEKDSRGVEVTRRMNKYEIRDFLVTNPDQAKPQMNKPEYISLPPMFKVEILGAIKHYDEAIAEENKRSVEKHDTKPISSDQPLPEFMNFDYEPWV